jgi:ATP-dependent helicase/nuclease subunit A
MLEEAVQENLATTLESKNLAVGGGGFRLCVVSESLIAPGRAKSTGKKIARKANWQPYVELWERRRDVHEAVIKKPVFVTPTLLKQQEKEIAEAASPKIHPAVIPTSAMVVGELAHRFLEVWDFAQEVDNFAERVGALLDQWLPSELEPERSRIETDLTEIFGGFFGSRIYAELAQSRILGRELPLLMPWNGQIMEGVIDLIYEYEGRLYLADYKTDRTARENLTQGVARHRQQADVYSRAARQGLQREVAAFKVIFLRLGEAVEIPLKASAKMLSPIQLNLL